MNRNSSSDRKLEIIGKKESKMEQLLDSLIERVVVLEFAVDDLRSEIKTLKARLSKDESVVRDVVEDNQAVQAADNLRRAIERSSPKRLTSPIRSTASRQSMASSPRRSSTARSSNGKTLEQQLKDSIMKERLAAQIDNQLSQLNLKSAKQSARNGDLRKSLTELARAREEQLEAGEEELTAKRESRLLGALRASNRRSNTGSDLA